MIGGYDPLGNISSLSRNGLLSIDNDDIPTYGPIDKLKYSYAGTSLLTGINESSNPEKGYASAGSTYGYDNTGNLTSDTGKGINNIQYTYNDLPSFIQMDDGTIEHFYDADGIKYKTIINENSGETTTYHYLNGVEYKDNQLEAIYHEEGRYVYERDENDAPVGEYFEWYLNDHLGNTRVRFADKDNNNSILVDEDAPEEDELLSSNHYYPFGMSMEGTWAPEFGEDNKYLYNGKEFISQLDLGWYDYGARFYDPSIGRFLQIDPLADQFPTWNPYHYVHNNPINLIDPTGMFAMKIDGIETKFVDEQGNTLIETKDGSDEVFVITENNMANFENDIVDLVQDGQESDIQANHEIGESNGFNLNDLEENAYGGFPVGSAYGDAGFHSGYLTGYKDEKSQPGMDFMVGMDQREFSTQSLQGRKIGVRHRKEGKMNMFNPQLQNNSPKYDMEAIQSFHPDILIKERVILKF